MSSGSHDVRLWRTSTTAMLFVRKQIHLRLQAGSHMAAAKTIAISSFVAMLCGFQLAGHFSWNHPWSKEPDASDVTSTYGVACGKEDRPFQSWRKTGGLPVHQLYDECLRRPGIKEGTIARGMSCPVSQLMLHEKGDQAGIQVDDSGKNSSHLNNMYITDQQSSQPDYRHTNSNIIQAKSIE